VNVNFGGFVPLSTVDWRGRSACVVFLRGCPIRCSYCQNAQLQTGEDFRDIEEIIGMIRDSAILVSGVVFSGGEPTMQREPLTALCEAATGMGLAVALQTNGGYPDVIESLLSRRLVDHVSLDLKTSWEWFGKNLPGQYLNRVRKSITLCREAQERGDLKEFQVVFTLFPGDIVPETGNPPAKKGTKRSGSSRKPVPPQEPQDFEKLAEIAEGADIVLQQGELKRYWESWSLAKKIDGVSYRTEKEVRGDREPLTLAELKRVADRMGKVVKIRTRDEGEVIYAGHRDCRSSGKRKR